MIVPLPHRHTNVLIMKVLLSHIVDFIGAASLSHLEDAI